MFGIKLEEKKVEYLELIYDLIFVYLIGRNSSLVHHVEDGFIRPGMYMTYVMCTLIIIQIWMYTAFYINRYGSNGVRDHIGIFINMYLLYYMADATRIDWQTSFYRYHIAWGLILLNMAFQYWIQLRHVSEDQPWESEHIQLSLRLLLIQAGAVLAVILVYACTGHALTPLPLLVGLAGSVVQSKVNRLMMVDFSHLSERAMLYIVFTFGEMIIAIAAYFAGGFSVNTVYFSIMAFLIVTGLFLSYGICYDHLIDREMYTNGAGYMLIHIFLIFSLNNLTMALEFMHDEEVLVIPKVRFLVVSFLLFLVCLVALRRYVKVRMKLTKRFATIGCTMAGVFVVLMAVFYRNMFINIAISVVFVYAILIMLFRFRKRMACQTEGPQ